MKVKILLWLCFYVIPLFQAMHGAKYSRINQVKFVEDSL